MITTLPPPARAPAIEAGARLISCYYRDDGVRVETWELAEDAVLPDGTRLPGVPATEVRVGQSGSR